MSYMNLNKSEMNKLLEAKEEELKGYIESENQGKEKKKRMKTGKKALWLGMFASIVLVVFSMAMIVIDKDTQTTSIIGGAGVAAIPVLFGIYEKYSNEISLKDMEMNYNPNYDEEKGLY